VGLRAHPEESGQQPEASLASLQATVRAKRRQRVIRAGPFSPEIGLVAGAPAVRASGGRACPPVLAWEGGPAGVSEVGAVTLGFPRNLGGLFVPAVCSASRVSRSTRTRALRLPASRKGAKSSLANGGRSSANTMSLDRRAGRRRKAS
jgi:hypothetical protein